MYNIEDLTEQARRSGASDIHLVCGLPPKYRLDGQLENMAEERLSEKDCDMLCQDLAKDAMYEKLEYTGELDFSREIRGIRCRCHVFKQQGKVSAAISLLPFQDWTLWDFLPLRWNSPASTRESSW